MLDNVKFVSLDDYLGRPGSLHRHLLPHLVCRVYCPGVKIPPEIDPVLAKARIIRDPKALRPEKKL